MNERVKDEQHLKRIVPLTGQEEDSSRSDPFGLGVRIDPAHARDSELVTRGVEWKEFEHFTADNTTVTTPASAAVLEAPDPLQLDTQFLEDVNQRFLRAHGQLESQKASLKQREQALHLQRLTFDEEQKRASQRIALDQSQLDARKTQLQKNESTFAERLIAFELQSRKFETEHEAFQRQRAELDRQKKTLREDVLAELRADQEELARAKLAFQKDFDQVHVLKEALHTRLDTLADDNAQTLKAEREKLWNSLTEEWDQRNLAFHQERDAWVKTRELEESNIDREKAMFEAAVESANAEFVKGRELLAIELTALRDHQSKQLEAERREWERTRSEQIAELANRTEAHQAEILASRENLDIEFEGRRTSLEHEFAAARERHQSNLTTEREEWEKSRRSEESDLLALRDALEQEINELRDEQTRSLMAAREKWEELREIEVAQLRTQDAELISARETLNRETIETRQALHLELEMSREKHAKELSAAQDEWEQTRERDKTRVEAQLAELLESCERLTIEISSSREQHEAELAAERDDLAAEQHDWEQTRNRDIEVLDAQKTELIAACESLKLELIELRAQHDANMLAERDEWEEMCGIQQSQFEAQQVEWLASRDSALQASRDALELEFIALREQHSAKLQAERDEWAQIVSRQTDVIEERQAELHRERTLLEKQVRFQQDHLDKCRAELEQAQNEYRHERQVERQRLEDSSMLMIRRLRQIDLYRTSIDAREQSLDREHEVFSKTRQALSNTADLDRLNFQAERHAWEQERQIQQQELRRQQEVLATRSEGLESRQTRLDKLRAELEETHRATLEMRLAVEEAWAQVTHVAGQDDARRRVEQVRQSLTGYYQQMHETISEQRREHLDVQTKFERQRAEFTEERQKLTSWLASRDEEMRLDEERLRIASADAASNHTKWLAARDRWLLEKAEAEQLIRRLLASLGENNREQSCDPDMITGMDEISGPREDLFAGLDR